MKLNTKTFGEIEYDESMVLHFESGLPGFPDMHRYILLTDDDMNELFVWLQCVDDEDVAFALMDVYRVMPEYNPLVDSDAIESLGDLSDGQLEIYNIAVIPEELREIRVNLKAPIVINPVTRRGMQVVVNNDDYSIRHYIFDDLEKVKAGV